MAKALNPFSTAASGRRGKLELPQRGLRSTEPVPVMKGPVDVQQGKEKNMDGQRRTWAHENEIRAWHDTHYAHTSPETKRSAWQRFANLQDPYNTGNFMTGWVQMIGGDEYGNLLIEEINERPSLQRITATTPKTSYPYRRDRAWLMNQSQWVRTALKYDGTNICQYSYQDADGNRFTTFKLRTRPFVPAHFRVMLDRSLRKYPGVAGISMEPGEAMVYELYGRQNPMLITYREEIELTALFRRNPDTGDIDPADPEDPAFARLDCPLSSARPPQQWQDSRQEYQKRQADYSAGLRETEVDGGKAFQGHEGEMLYVRFPDGARTKPGAFTRLIKLKPPEIEEIHQALDHVPKAEAEATARNIWEVADEPELEHLLTMLREDWSEDQLRRSMDTIRRVLEETLERRRREDEILEIFGREFAPEQFRDDKATVMRALSEHFSKQAMNRVFSTLDKRLP